MMVVIISVITRLPSELPGAHINLETPFYELLKLLNASFIKVGSQGQLPKGFLFLQDVSVQ